MKFKTVMFLLGAALAAAMLMQNAHSQTENISGTLLPSAIRTTTSPVDSTDRTNNGWRGLHIIINISTYTSGTFTPTIQGRDPISGNYYTVLAGSAISTSTGSPFILRVYPGLTAGANIGNDVLPRLWRVRVVGASTPNAAYSVSFHAIQ